MSSEPSSRKGLILINTGPGKGKTTAALGTALRAVGCGMKVLVLQFIKGSWHYGELDAAETLGPNFVLRQMGRGFVKIGGAEADPKIFASFKQPGKKQARRSIQVNGILWYWTKLTTPSATGCSIRKS